MNRTNIQYLMPKIGIRIKIKNNQTGQEIQGRAGVQGVGVIGLQMDGSSLTNMFEMEEWSWEEVTPPLEDGIYLSRTGMVYRVQDGEIYYLPKNAGGGRCALDEESRCVPGIRQGWEYRALVWPALHPRGGALMPGEGEAVEEREPLEHTYVVATHVGGRVTIALSRGGVLVMPATEVANESAALRVAAAWRVAA